MYIHTNPILGQEAQLGEEPDPAALRAQQELIERRRKILEQGEKLEQEQSHRRNLELLERGEFERSVKAIARELSACLEAPSSKGVRQDCVSRKPLIQFRSHEHMIFLPAY